MLMEILQIFAILNKNNSIPKVVPIIISNKLNT